MQNRFKGFLTKDEQNEQGFLQKYANKHFRHNLNVEHKLLKSIKCLKIGVKLESISRKIRKHKSNQ
jgi:hypothetical protein